MTSCLLVRSRQSTSSRGRRCCYWPGFHAPAGGNVDGCQHARVTKWLCLVQRCQASCRGKRCRGHGNGGQPTCGTQHNGVGAVIRGSGAQRCYHFPPSHCGAAWLCRTRRVVRGKCQRRGYASERCGGCGPEKALFGSRCSQAGREEAAGRGPLRLHEHCGGGGDNARLCGAEERCTGDRGPQAGAILSQACYEPGRNGRPAPNGTIARMRQADTAAGARRSSCSGARD